MKQKLDTKELIDEKIKEHFDHLVSMQKDSITKGEEFTTLFVIVEFDPKDDDGLTLAFCPVQCGNSQLTEFFAKLEEKLEEERKRGMELLAVFTSVDAKMHKVDKPKLAAYCAEHNLTFDQLDQAVQRSNKVRDEVKNLAIAQNVLLFKFESKDENFMRAYEYIEADGCAVVENEASQQFTGKDLLKMSNGFFRNFLK